MHCRMRKMPPLVCCLLLLLSPTPTLGVGRTLSSRAQALLSGFITNKASCTTNMTLPPNVTSTSFQTSTLTASLRVTSTSTSLSRVTWHNEHLCCQWHLNPCVRGRSLRRCSVIAALLKHKGTLLTPLGSHLRYALSAQVRSRGGPLRARGTHTAQ